MDVQIRSTAGYIAMACLVASAGFVAWNLWNYYLLASVVAAAPTGNEAMKEFDLTAILDLWDRRSEGARAEEESLQTLVA
jgi:hypothetical protein